MAQSCLATKFVSRFGDLVGKLAVEAVLCVTVDSAPRRGDDRTVVEEKKGKIGGRGAASISRPKKEIDIKRYARVEKIPGGLLSDCKVLNGVMVEKDVVHPKMKRVFHKPRVILCVAGGRGRVGETVTDWSPCRLDCPLEYKKGESQTNLEISKETDWEAVLKIEEEYVEKLCTAIIKLKPDVVCTEKGVSDLAAHYFVKAGISCIRRLRKTDNNRIARATGATIVNEVKRLIARALGTAAGLLTRVASAA